MSKKETTVRYCKCGAQLPADDPEAKLCQACRKRRLKEQRAEHRSLSVEDEARRDETLAPMPGQHMTIREVVRAADAMGISYGRFVSLGLDKRKRE